MERARADPGCAAPPARPLAERAAQYDDAFQFPASCDPLVRELIEWLPDYERKVDEFLAGPFAPERIAAKLARWTALLDSAVRETEAAGKGPSHSHWMKSVQELETEISRRRWHRGHRIESSDR